MARLGGRDVAALADQQIPGMVVWTTYIAVDDVDSTVAKALAAGGTVLMEPMDVMTFGRMAVVTDPGGAAVSFWQAGEHKGAGPVNEPGTLCGNELTTRAVGGLMPMEGDIWPPDLPNHWMVYFAVLNDPQGGHPSIIELAQPI